MDTPSKKLTDTVSKVATIAQAALEAGAAARRAIANRIEAEATGREEVSGAGSGGGEQAQG